MPTFARILPVTLVAALLAIGAFAPASRAQLVRNDVAPDGTKTSGDASAQSAVPARGKLRLSKDFTLKGDSHWTDTQIDMRPGEHLVVSASGKLQYADAKSDNGPGGLTRGFKDLIRILPFNGAGRGALLGRVGEADFAQPFLIGAQHEVMVPVEGRLALGINQANSETSEGSYKVHIDVYEPDASALASVQTIAKKVDTIPGIDTDLFAKLPRRITDKAGSPGDMVNFLILGSEDDMQKVFTTAGWVKVDADVQGTVLHGLLDSLSKQSYLTMPMSPLYLFGRVQDYGWAHAEPIDVVRSRNHLRIWKAPFDVNGVTLWVGAATHDIGFERDQRNNGVTHKIDPDIDLERDYVEKTLVNTGLVAELSHFLPESPMKEAKTATGGSFHSNGEVLILKLVPTAGTSTAQTTH